jgi:hypothetical protein
MKVDDSTVIGIHLPDGNRFIDFFGFIRHAACKLF